MCHLEGCSVWMTQRKYRRRYTDCLAILSLCVGAVNGRLNGRRHCVTHRTSASLRCCFMVYLYRTPAVRTRETASPGCRRMVAPEGAELVDPCCTTCIVAGYAVLLLSSKSTSYGTVLVGDMASSDLGPLRGQIRTHRGPFKYSPTFRTDLPTA